MKLHGLVGSDDVLVADLVLCEVLRGCRDEMTARTVSEYLAEFDFAVLGSRDIALEAAANYRKLRTRGVTVRGTLDLIIGTYCIVNGHMLLHADHDFVPLTRHLGLKTV